MMDSFKFEVMEKYINFLRADLSKVPLRVKKQMLKDLKKMLKSIDKSDSR
jgi:hypothetical protein